MLAQPQTKDEAAQKFQHRYASTYYVRFKQAEWGGLRSDTLVIVSNIPLEPGTEGYSEEKVLCLERAVSNFVKARHSPYRNVEFIQKDA